MEPKVLEQELREGWVTRSQAARLADVSIEAVRLWHANGKVAILDTPCGRLYSRSDIERVAAQRKGG